MRHQGTSICVGLGRMSCISACSTNLTKVNKNMTEFFTPFHIEGAFFQIKMTPNQIIMTAYEEDAFLIIFLRFDSNSLTRIKSANLG